MNPWRFVAILTTLGAIACSGPSEPRVPQKESQPDPSNRSLSGPFGVVEGRVVVDSETPPKPTKVRNTTDPEHCGEIHSLENIIVSPENHGLKNTIVALADLPLPEGYEPPHSQLVLDNRECRFDPHVAVLTTGSTIKALNSDPIYHSVHLYGLKQLNVSLHVSKSRIIELPRRPGYVIVKCDVHGWMQAYIRVDRHPLHAVTGEDGSFRIEGVPQGTHRLEVWHEHFGPQKHSVSVEPNGVSQLTISYGMKNGG